MNAQVLTFPTKPAEAERDESRCLLCACIALACPAFWIVVAVLAAL